MNSQPLEQNASPDIIAFRQAAFLALGSGLSIAGFWLLLQILRVHGLKAVEIVMLGLFVLLFTQIAFGFAIAFYGFVIRIRGGDSVNVMNSANRTESDPAPVGSTAIVMPIYNEDTQRVFAGIESIYRSLEKTGRSDDFDFFILSDSNQPAQWINEECAWVDLCARLNGFNRIFYRKRRVAQHGKSGNIADFCRRWGKRYRYMIILDADSVMQGSLMVRLARVMDANPGIGMIQTVPTLSMGRSLWQRLFQFSSAVLSPIFTAGSNFWHLGGGAYWGHNAIIRLKPFMEHCVLPELPSEDPSDRHILSHDTVEAALMHQAGYEVWLAAEEQGSYEEGPPNISESLKRDRRWCQGNLQHTWFLFAPKIRFTNRLHIFFGLMGYINAPLLILFIVLSCINDYWQQRYEVLAAQVASSPSTFGIDDTFILFGLTLVLLFLPTILGGLVTVPRARQFGGWFRLGVSLLIQTIFSVLIAPTLMYFHSQFVLLTILGLRVTWTTQTRNQSQLPWLAALRTYAGPTILSAVAYLLCSNLVPNVLWWLSPLLIGWAFSIPLAVLTSSESVGQWLKDRGLLLSPEEVNPCEELSSVESASERLPTSSATFAKVGRIIDLFLSPYVNAVHLSMLHSHSPSGHLKREYLEQLQRRLTEEGPQALSLREITALIWDAETVHKIHRNLWQMEESGLHPDWRKAMREHHQLIRYQRG